MKDIPMARPGHLTLAQLASHDDLITDALVDQVYFWTTIRKNRARYSACRGVREDDITNIIRQSIAVEKDPAKATEQLLQLPGFKRYSERLLMDQDRDHFHRHLRKYVNMYMPDCPFEVSTTNRYTIDTEEAAATARRFIEKGELIKYLSGIQVALTREEEQDLDLTRRDFSIVMSSRKKTPSLFLGPARFANHDCDSNARLTTRGSNGMAVVAAKDIQVGEEITVTYGTDYFGINNCECLCVTCEKSVRNGWAPRNGVSSKSEQHNMSDTSINKLDAGRDPALADLKLGTSSSPHNDTLKEYETAPKTSNAMELDSVMPHFAPKNPRLDKLRADVSEPHLPTTIHIGSTLRHQSIASGSSIDRSDSPALSLIISSNMSGTSTAATSVSNSEDENEDEPTLASSLIGPPKTVIFDVPVQMSSNTSDKFNDGKASTKESDSDLSELDDNFVLDNSLRQVVRRYKTRNSANNYPPGTSEQLHHYQQKDSADIMLSDSSANSKGRYPGDYTLTPLLVSTPYCRWVQCRVCSRDFVQVDAYQTRWSCPRCERHSKLYGYQWPKTEKIGKNDTEERILDPRLVHRFVWADEEKGIKKGKRALRKLLEERQESGSCDEFSIDKFKDISTTCRKRRRVKTFAANLDTGSNYISQSSIKSKRAADHYSRSTSQAQFERNSKVLENLGKGSNQTRTGSHEQRQVLDDVRANKLVVGPIAKRKYIRSGKYSKIKAQKILSHKSAKKSTSQSLPVSASKGLLQPGGLICAENEKLIERRKETAVAPGTKRKYIKSGRYAGVWKKYHPATKPASASVKFATKPLGQSSRTSHHSRNALSAQKAAQQRQIHSIFMKDGGAYKKPYDLRTPGSATALDVQPHQPNQPLHGRLSAGNESKPLGSVLKRTYVKSGKFVGVAAAKRYNLERSTTRSNSMVTSKSQELERPGKLKRPSLRRTMNDVRKELPMTARIATLEEDQH